MVSERVIHWGLKKEPQPHVVRPREFEEAAGEAHFYLYSRLHIGLKRQEQCARSFLTQHDFLRHGLAWGRVV